MFSQLYDRGYLCKCLITLGVVFGLMRVTNGAGFAIVIPMIFYCILARKLEGLLFWLLLAVCAIIINPYLVPKAGGFPWMQRGVMVFLGLAMAVNVLSYRLHYVFRPYVGIFFYVIFMAFSSSMGWCPVISYLKLALFSLVYFAYLGVSNLIGVNMNVSGKKIRSIMLAFAVLFVFGSMVLVPFPGLSQLRAENFLSGRLDLSTTTSLFIGMANHSQCLGPVISSISVVLFGDLLFSLRKADLLYVFLLLCCPYIIYLTSSRTGMGAYVLGMLFVVYTFLRAHRIGKRWRFRVLTFFMLFSIAAMLIVFMLPGVQNRVARFVLKSQSVERGQLTTESVISSRRGLIDYAMYNFKKSPVVGNGFQVSEAMARLKIKDGVQLLSAPIEKGVWVTAILEEGGVIGWSIFVVFLIVCIVKSLNRGAYVGASCLFLSVLTNLGEFTFFSMSYTGGFTWAMVFMGLAMDIRRIKDDEMRQMMYQGWGLRESGGVWVQY